jgi:excisionase family DNA binding protein
MLTTEDVSKWLGIAPRTLCTWAECGELPAVKVGRQWRFRRTEVMVWLERPTRPQLLGQSAASTAIAATAAYNFPKTAL